jgi:hypothetical protein
MIPDNESTVLGVADARDGLDERRENRSSERLKKIGLSDATES